MSDTRDAQLIIAALEHVLADSGAARMEGVVFITIVVQSAGRAGSCLG